MNREVKVIGNMDNTIDHTFESANRVYDQDGLCPTIPTCGGGNIQPKIIEKTKCVGGLSDSKWGDKQYHQQDRVYKGDIALAHPANMPEGSYKYIVKDKNYRIRKLTPRECWRLMGYTDADFDKAASVNSNSQLYKEAGNAIVKQVLMALFLQMGIKGVRK